VIVRDPIYQQLNQALRQLVESGKFSPGDRFLTERDVCARFGVSRPTANKALASLVSEGLLQFQKGVGTFVAGGGLDYDLQALVSFTGRAKAAGKTPTTRVLQFNIQSGKQISAEVSRRLKLSVGEKVYCIKRLRLADGVPMILEQRHIVARLCPGLTAKQAAGSLYDLWTQHFKLDIAGADQAIRAVSLPLPDAQLLGVRRGAAALLADAVGYVFGNVPLWHEQTLYRADRYAFHTHLGGLQRPRSGAAVSRFAELSVQQVGR
jgi:GntR family transcriptional regulator